MKNTTVYFPNLNGIRFIAALAVIIHHIEQFKAIFSLDSLWESSKIIRSIGGLGVVLFFTLSGFLITYLLLFEQKQAGNISIKQFYIRRILRIWPLYFFIFFLSFFILRNMEYFHLPILDTTNVTSLTIVIMFCFFLSNYFLANYGVLAFASQTWSVSTEEQFYFIWPWIIKFGKNTVVSLILVIVIVSAVKVFLISPFSDGLPDKSKLLAFWKMFNIDCMAIGGIFAYLLFIDSKILKYIVNVYVFYFALLSMVALLAFKIYIPIITTYFNYDLWAFLFGLFILNMAVGKKLLINLENSLFNYLGKISYGLYMYHSIAIFVIIKFLISIKITNGILIFLLSLGLTILLAHVSYFYFENLFLKLKYRFTKITSGSN